MIAKKAIIISFALIVFATMVISALADIDGRTGRTRKTSTSGCGSCHGSTATTGVTVLLSGPDTLTAGQTGSFSITITRSGKLGAGIDIATRRGTLAAVTAGTRVSSGEIVHNDNLTMTSGTVTIQFNYTAPSTEGPDTLWATGLATNSSGSQSGDEWNWAAEKRINVRLATSINNSQYVVPEFELLQNFPNPFNPSTKIRYVLSSRSNVMIRITDIAGRDVAVPVNEMLSPGEYSTKFDAQNLAGGVYFCSMFADGKLVKTRSLVLKK